jgi:FhaA, N-terminal domain/FHA domain
VILRTIEHKIESLVEGVFGRAFRTNVQPVELARKLTKEMDDHRNVSVSRVYVPNEYTLYLSTVDRAQFEAYEASLKLELQEYLGQHAKREGYVMLAPPAVVITTDGDLAMGEFGIATRMVQGSAGLDAAEPLAAAGPGRTMVYKPARVPAGDVPGDDNPAAREVVALVAGGNRHQVTKRTTVIGRSQGCDIRLDDANISRRHAELRQQGTSYWIVDLGSTNGLEVNGSKQLRAKLEDGDTVTLGETELVFSRAVP